MKEKFTEVTGEDGQAESVAVLQLVTGISENQAFWAYMAMNPASHEEYLERISRDEHVDLTEYGMVLQSGWGEEPPAEIRAQMEQEYGFDDGFADQVIEMIEKGEIELKEKEA